MHCSVATFDTFAYFIGFTGTFFVVFFLLRGHLPRFWLQVHLPRFGLRVRLPCFWFRVRLPRFGLRVRLPWFWLRVRFPRFWLRVRLPRFFITSTLLVFGCAHWLILQNTWRTIFRLTWSSNCPSLSLKTTNLILSEKQTAYGVELQNELTARK